MVTLERIKEFLCDNGCEDAIVFENPEFCKAFLGVSDDGRLVYDYAKMIESLMEEEDLSEEESIDFVNYNTIRAIPYMGEKAPIILYPFRED